MNVYFQQEAEFRWKSMHANEATNSPMMKMNILEYLWQNILADIKLIEFRKHLLKNVNVFFVHNEIEINLGLSFPQKHHRK